MKLPELNLNLDSYINPKQLQNTAIALSNHPRLYAKKYFNGQNYPVITIKLLQAYAWNKSTAMILRAEGNIQTAIKYENICDKIYNKLPNYAAW
jgi:hypothetical protein